MLARDVDLDDGRVAELTIEDGALAHKFMSWIFEVLDDYAHTANRVERSGRIRVDFYCGHCRSRGKNRQYLGCVWIGDDGSVLGGPVDGRTLGCPSGHAHSVRPEKRIAAAVRAAANPQGQRRVFLPEGL